MKLVQDILENNKWQTPPVWIMRQAGRYMPEYRAIRSQMSFLELCRSPETACEVSLQPIDIVKTDFAIIFSDILLPLCDYGIGVEFPNTGGINITANNLDNLEYSDQGNISATCQAIKLLRQELNNRNLQETPIFGFCGGPWTLATYILEGGTAREFTQAKSLLLSNSEKAHKLLDQLSNSMAEYLNKQIEAGANIIQIFETWSGELTQEQFKNIVKPYLKKILAQLPETTPKSLYLKNITPYLYDLADIGFDVISIDWKISLTNAWEILSNNPDNTVKCLQGNLDPVLLTLDNTETIKQAIINNIKEGQALPCNHILNLGHGITPNAKVSNAQLFVETAKNFE